MFTLYSLQILLRKPLGWEKKDFSKTDFGSLLKNQIQAAVKMKNDGEILRKLYVIVKEPATFAIEFYPYDFVKSIPRIWAQENIFCST